MSSGSWDSTGGGGADVGGLGGSSLWNMSGLANGLPPSIQGGAVSNMDKQNRWGSFPSDISSSGPSDSASVGWGQSSSSMGRDSASLGWGRPDSDAGSDSGAKGWESSRSSAWGIQVPMSSDKPGSEWSDSDTRKNGIVNRDFSSPWDRPNPKSWGDIAPEQQQQSSSQNGLPSSSASSLPALTSQPTTQGQPPSNAAARASSASSNEQNPATSTTPASEVDGSGDAKAAGNGPPAIPTREEVMLRAINSSEPWGRTPIRQDVPWVLEEEPVREPLPPIQKAPVVDQTDVQFSRIGTAGWEQMRSGSGSAGWIGSGRTRDDSGNWSISPPDAVGLGAIGGQSVLPPGVGGMPAFRAPVERPVSSTGGLLAPSGATGWGLAPGLEPSEMWKDDEKKDMRAALGVGGMTQPPIRRNLSAGSWPEDPSWNAATGASGVLPEMDGMYGQGRDWRGSRPGTAQQPSQPGFRKPGEGGDMFGVPPPNLQPGYRPSSRAGSHEDITSGQWNQLPVKLPNAAGGWGEQSAQWQPGMVDANRLRAPPSAASWNDDWNGARKPQQQTRSRILQQLTDIGFRKEEAQSALINNNMDVRLALAELTAGHGGSDPSRRLLRCASEDLSHAGSGMPQGGPPLDISATSLFGQSSQNIRFPPGAGANMPGRQQQAIVDQLQQQQQQQRLLSSLLNPSNVPLGPPQSQAQVLQKLLQQQDAQSRVLSAESAQVAALQQQQQIQLMQSVHAAVQAGLIPPHLLTNITSLNPTIAVKLQRMVQLFDVFQKLNVQSQMVAGSGAAGQQELSAALTTVKQQIVQMQQEVVVALAATSTVPPPPIAAMQQPPPSIVPPASGDLVRGMPSSNDELAASKLSQWKQQPTSDMSKQMQPPNGPLSSSANWPTGLSGSSAMSQGGDKSSADSGANSAAAAANLDIEEFVPGKPWQGPSVRSVEDDPYITPGSVTRSTISAVDDAHVMNVLGGKSVGAIGKPIGGGSAKGSAVWSNDGADARGSHSAHQQQPIGRSVSWAAGERSMSAFGPPMVGFPNTTSLRIRNLPPQVDNSFIQALCERYGPLRYFIPSAGGDQVIMSYQRAEDAANAQRSLSAGTPGSIPPLVIEFIADADMMRMLEQSGGLGPASMPPKQPTESNWGQPPNIGGGAFGAGGGGGGATGGSLWGSGGALGADETHGYLPSDLFGGQ